MASAKRKVVPTYKKQPKKAADWRPVFLSGLLNTPFAVGRCAEAAGVSRRMVYKERDASAEFAEIWDTIVEGAIDDREQSLFNCTNPIASKHENLTGLIFFLKARRKAIYGGVGDGPERPPAVVIFRDGRNNA